MFEDRQMWMYRTTSSATIDLTGFEVEAVDGSIGHVDSATQDIGVAAVVVDTGPWIFGRKTRSKTLRSTTRRLRRRIPRPIGLLLQPALGRPASERVNQGIAPPRGRWPPGEEHAMDSKADIDPKVVSKP